MQLSSEALMARTVALAQTFSGGTLCIRTGGMPSDCKSAASGQEIASFSLGDRIGVQGSTIAVVSSPLRAIAQMQGVPGHWRIEKGGKCIAQAPIASAFPQLAGEVEQGQMIEITAWSMSDRTVDA